MIKVPYNTPFNTVKKAWGSEIWYSLTNDYCFKKITITAGHKTSLQYHEEKEETNVIASGKGVAVIQDPHTKETKIYDLKPGDMFHFKPGVIHRFEAIDEDLVMYEASSKQIGDVVRLEDSYGRKGTKAP